MSDTLAAGLAYRRLLAGYPGLHVSDDTAQLWVEAFGAVPDQLRAAAISELHATCRRWPTLADLHAVLARHREAAAERRDDEWRRELEDPGADPDVARAAIAAARVLAEDRRTAIVEGDLDAAGIPDWRGRLARARAAGPPFDRFDREWEQLRAEWVAAGSPRRRQPPAPRRPPPRPAAYGTTVAGGLAEDLAALARGGAQ